jgi:hypothetical protein
MRDRFELAADVRNMSVDCPLVRFDGNTMDGVEKLGTGEDSPWLTGEGL